MRFFALLLPSVIAIPNIAVAAAHPAAGQAARSLSHQVTRKTLEIRAKYPEVFRKLSPWTSSGSGSCDWWSWKRSSEVSDPSCILSPEDVAAFLLGGGTYMHSNGTQVTDFQWAKLLDDEERKVAGRSSLNNYVRDTLTSSLVDFSLPHYKRWRDKFNSDSKAVVHLSPNTAFLAGDIPEIERALLRHPEFDEVQVGKYRITRRFIEAAQLYI
ncbi:hypothetical protein FRB99_005338 [Tulasnella sp. 403]|nr:hypothetical protein FRB99_005338 [Tulasnella sp. 403]